MFMYQQDLEKLSVGDKVGYISSCTQEACRARPVTVVRITATRVVVKRDDVLNPIEHAFMKSTGREVGSSSSWRSAHLVPLSDVEADKQRQAAEEKFQATVNKATRILQDHYRCSHMRPEVKEELLQLINSL